MRGRPSIGMGLLERQTLKQRRRKGGFGNPPLQLDELLEVGFQLADALRLDVDSDFRDFALVFLRPGRQNVDSKNLHTILKREGLI